MSTYKEELEQTLNQTKAELAAIEFAEDLKRNLPLVGKYFSYAKPSPTRHDPSDYCYVYIAVVGAGGSGLTTWRFEQDENRQVIIGLSEHITSIPVRAREITFEHFAESWNRTREKLDLLFVQGRVENDK